MLPLLVAWSFPLGRLLLPLLLPPLLAGTLLAWRSYPRATILVCSLLSAGSGLALVALVAASYLAWVPATQAIMLLLAVADPLPGLAALALALVDVARARRDRWAIVLIAAGAAYLLPLVYGSAMFAARGLPLGAVALIVSVQIAYTHAAPVVTFVYAVRGWGRPSAAPRTSPAPPAVPLPGA